MITSLDAGSEQFLAAVGRTQRRLAAANLQVASGKRVNVASDAPGDIAELLQLKADQRHNLQIQSNMAMAKTDAEAADRAMDGAIRLMDRASVLAAQAGSPALDAGGWATLAQEVQALQEQMVASSGTTVRGRFLFSGDQDSGPAYALDLTAATGVVQLSAAPATTRLEDAAGGTFACRKTAQEIFDSRNPDGTIAPENVFAALNSLRLALVNNDAAALDAARLSIGSASDHLSSMQAFYGTVEIRIDNAVNFAADHDIELRAEISQKEDADIAAAAIEVTQASTQLEAAFQMRGRLPRRSLFDYLA